MIYNFEELSFRPVSVRRFVHRDGAFDVSPRPYASVSFRTRGTGKFEIGEKQFAVTVGDLLFIPAGMPYRVEYQSSESIVVHLEDCNYTDAEHVCITGAASVARRFEKLVAVWNEKHSVNLAKSLLYEILEKISEDKKAISDDTAFAKCVAYVDSHFCDPELDVDRICAHGFISASGLQRKFQRHFGSSPKQYLTKLRMNRALELLIANELSVREIAFACGFSDDKYFSRAFKEHYGYPPSKMKHHMLE